MKKVLFTLAALMMAGSLCAEEYMYIEDFEVSQEMLQQTAARNRRVTVPVKAHFDNYVSAWQVDLGGEEMNVLPGGVTVFNAAAGADMTVPYMDIACTELTVSGSWGTGQNNTRFISAIAGTAGFWFAPGLDPDNDDPVSYGIVKWLGDYDQMFTVTFQFPQDFTGAQFAIWTAPSSGADTRGPITAGEVVKKTFNITVEQAQVTPEDFVGTADVTFDGNVATISYTSNDPNATVEVTLNGNPLTVEFVNGVATWEAPVAAEQTEPGDYSYTVAIKVTPDGENFVGDPVSDSDTYAYTVEKTATPVINVIHKDGSHAYFTVEGAGDVVVLVDGVAAVPAVYNGVPCYVVYSVLGEPVSYEVTATAKEDGKLISDVATETISFEAWDGVDELVNGKAVAGVRYYNMAGQEMQQANGMTIVVTTYTDGTTSAVKVMK